MIAPIDRRIQAITARYDADTRAPRDPVTHYPPPAREDRGDPTDTARLAMSKADAAMAAVYAHRGAFPLTWRSTPAPMAETQAIGFAAKGEPLGTTFGLAIYPNPRGLDLCEYKEGHGPTEHRIFRCVGLAEATEDHMVEEILDWLEERVQNPLPDVPGAQIGGGAPGPADLFRTQ